MMDEPEVASVVHVGVRMELKITAKIMLTVILAQEPHLDSIRMEEVWFYATDIEYFVLCGLDAMKYESIFPLFSSPVKAIAGDI